MLSQLIQVSPGYMRLGQEIPGLAR